MCNDVEEEVTKFNRSPWRVRKLLPERHNKGGWTKYTSKCYRNNTTQAEIRPTTLIANVLFFCPHTFHAQRDTARFANIFWEREQRAVVFTSTTKSANDKAKVSITLYVAELNEHRQNRWKEQNNSKRQTVATNQHQEFQDMTWLSKNEFRKRMNKEVGWVNIYLKLPTVHF